MHLKLHIGVRSGRNGSTVSVKKLGNGKFYLIGDAIETQFLSNNLHLAAALSLVLMIILLVGMFIMNKFSDKSEGGLMI